MQANSNSKHSSIKAQTFTTIPNRVFIKAKSQCVSIPKEDSPAVSVELMKKGKLMKAKRFFAFYSDRCIYYKAKDATKIKGVALYDFDLKLEWLFHGSEKEYKSSESPYGFKFIRGSNVVELSFVDIDDYGLVSQFLRKKINILNFHFWYKAIKKIGKGNFAAVYLVESRETGFNYAVKAFLKETLYAQKKGRDSIKNEIQIMRTLDHLNVISLHEVYETENSLYLVMELLKGGNMISYLTSKKKIPDEEVRIFLSALLKAVAHLHEKGVMHRDIKPENILLRNLDIKETNICLADFGLSTFINVEKFLFSRCGTPGFVAPEIFNYENGSKKYSEICDEFSVGVIFHILLFGVSVFNGRSYNTVVKQNKECHFNFKSSMYDRISKETKDLLKSLLETNPDKRIYAKDALEHEYFTGSIKKSLDEDLGHTLAYNLKMFNARKFEIKNITELNETIYIPIDCPNERDRLNSNSSSQLISAKPCMNGFLNTYDNINSLFSNVDEVINSEFLESPGIQRVTTTSSRIITNPKICFYEKKNPHKISDFLDYGKKVKKVSCDVESEMNEKNECESLPLSPLMDLGKKKLGYAHKNSNFLEYYSKN